MRIRRMIVRAINKIRGVDVDGFIELRYESGVSITILALYMNLPYIILCDWEMECAAIPKAQYEKAMQYMRERLKEREKLERKEFMESPVWRD